MSGLTTDETVIAAFIIIVFTTLIFLVCVIWFYISGTKIAEAAQASAQQQAETARAKAEEGERELVLALDWLAEHDRLKSRFFANVSHEPRTPLTLVLTPLQQLMSDGSNRIPDAVRAKLASIRGSTTIATRANTRSDATRCARMAKEIFGRADAVCERWGDILTVAPPISTMVLCSGEATLGSFGSPRRMDYSAEGGPVDEAELLARSIMPGQLVCATSTWELIQRAKALIGMTSRLFDDFPGIATGHLLVGVWRQTCLRAARRIFESKIRTGLWSVTGLAAHRSSD